LLVVVVIGIAYGVGWMSDAILNDDPCLGTYLREGDQYDYVQRWFPARADCRVTTPAGSVRVEPGSSEVFLTTFALTLIVALALAATIRLVWRATVIVVACVAAVLVIFV
jgi:hypothetical protein